MLLPTITARASSVCESLPGSFGNLGSEGSKFIAPPTVDASLAMHATFLFATAIQLGIAISSLFRYGRRVSGIATIVALAFSAVAYALQIAYDITNWTVTDCGGLQVASQSLRSTARLETATTLFYSWMDPLILTTVVLVLRDRYLDFEKRPGRGLRPVIPLLPLMIASCVFAALVFILSTVYASIAGAALAVLPGLSGQNTQASTLNYVHLINLSNNFYYAYMAFYIAATFLLPSFAIVVKKFVKADKIASLTLIAIIPLLILRALSRLIIIIITAHLDERNTPNAVNDLYKTNLASAFLDGVFYVAVLGILVFFLAYPQQQWDADEGHLMLKDIGNHSNQGPRESPWPRARSSFDSEKTRDELSSS